MNPFSRRNRKARLPAVLLALFASSVSGVAPTIEPVEESIRLDHVRAYIERTRGWKVEDYSLRPMASDSRSGQLPVYRVFPDARVRQAPLDEYPVDIFLDGRSGEVVGEDIVRPASGSAAAASSGDAP